jgi:hypothetical protein
LAPSSGAIFSKLLTVLLAVTVSLRLEGAESTNGLSSVRTADSNPAPINQTVSYQRHIAPLLDNYCVECHSGSKPKGDLVLRFDDEKQLKLKAAGNKESWGRIAEMLSSREMPPSRARHQPTDAERELFVNWIQRDVLAIDCSTPNPGSFKVHRLNNREFANTIRDLLYLPELYDAAADFPADERGAGFDNNSDTLTISSVLIEHHLASAAKAAEFAMNIYGKGSPTSRAKLRAPQDAAREDFANRQALIRLNVQKFLPRAYRREVTSEEIDEIMRFASLSFTHDGELFDKATALTIRTALMSPEFLFRLERDPSPDGSGKVYRIGEFELANRLSYFLWATMPDDELFAVARANQLREELDVQVRRMLKHPKAASLTKDFMGQWLEIRSLEETPNCPPELLAAMKRETEQFFNYIIQDDRSIMEFLNADYTFVNETLAKHYGIPDIEGGEFRKVQVDTEKRGGIFTQASFLTITGKPIEVKGAPPTRRTSAVNRGKWILENIFNAKIPPPPPEVPALDFDPNKELKGTTRQILEQHRADPKCADCHARMDPFGFALENYDGFGAWRTRDNQADVDASGEIDGKKFTTPREFRTILAARKTQFRRAFVEKLLSYALGRGLEDYDMCAVGEICAAVEKEGDRFSSVLLNLVKSFPFQHARGSVTNKPRTAAN